MNHAPAGDDAPRDMPSDPRTQWAALSQTEKDAAYDNGAAVADSAARTRDRNVRSAAFRANWSGSLDLPYGPRERNRWDLYPAADSKAPCLVFIHGGYWQRNRREDFAIIAEGVQSRGWSAALPGYTLAPEASLTEIVREIEAALDWLAANRTAHGIAGPVILSGWSAGGHLTAQCLAHPVVTAGLAVSGVFELQHIRDTNLNDALKLSEAEVAALAPLNHPPTMKPLAIAYGSKELTTLVNDSRNLYVARLAAGAPGFLMTVMGADHFSILDEYAGPDGELLDALQRLLPA